MPKAKRAAPDSDYLLSIAQQHWPEILTVYKQFEDKKPVMLYDVQEQRIYAYPFTEFRDEMCEQSQHSLTEQYDAALRDDKLVIFIRDNDQRRLVSFSMAIEL